LKSTAFDAAPGNPLTAFGGAPPEGAHLEARSVKSVAKKFRAKI
jgi:hypothetical protein